MAEDIKDIKFIELLTNKPSDPISIKNSRVRVVFQAPSFTDKYKGRSWATKKLKEIGITDSEDEELAYYFRYWGTLNVHVKKLYVESDSGEISIEDKKYYEYTIDREKDLNYSFVFEKYVFEEMVPRGLDEGFVTSTILAHIDWIRDRALEEADIKNS